MNIRPAKIEDSNDILEWRNDVVTRNMSFDTNEISVDAHTRWFSSSLNSPTRHLYIGFDDKNKIGICRFDFDSNSQQSEISINLNPRFRGKGMSKDMLNSAITVFLKECKSPIIARIKKENLASIRLFESCGFVANSTQDNNLNYIFLI